MIKYTHLYIKCLLWYVQMGAQGAEKLLCLSQGLLGGFAFCDPNLKDDPHGFWKCPEEAQGD